MNIFLTGSHELTKYDKLEILNYLQNYVTSHEIHLLCYRSIENEVLRFFVENDEYAENLHLYTLQPLAMVPEAIKQSIMYLKAKGSLYHSFGIEEIKIKRSDYEDAWRNMLDDINLVICFYNKDKPSALIPVDLAKEKNIDAIVFDLPGYSEEKMDIPFEKKIRIV